MRKGTAEIQRFFFCVLTVWCRVLLLDPNGIQLGASGMLRPGEYVKSIAFDKIPPNKGFCSCIQAWAIFVPVEILTK